MKHLLVAATSREARILERFSPVVCGTGEAAGTAVANHLRRDAYDLVLVAGWCGGLDPSLGAGGLILGRQVLLPGSEIIEPDRLLIEEVRHELHARRLPFVYSRLLTVDEPAATLATKRDLWNEHGAGGVDMETWHVARAAREARVPWLAVRVVTDPAKTALPGVLARWHGEADRTILLRAATRPRDWPGLVRLAVHMPAASRTLRRGVFRVLSAARQARTVETLPLVEVS
jgi:adenosylhomocysteine nucleosidase